MTPLPASRYNGHHAAARRLADAIFEAAKATMSLDDDELDVVAGGMAGLDQGFNAAEVYRASADFIADWRADSAT